MPSDDYTVVNRADKAGEYNRRYNATNFFFFGKDIARAQC